MSAITGIYNFDDAPVSLEESQSLMNALQRYSADATDTWQEGSVFLGCHAKWITPESVHERLPHYDSEQRLAITADAIIDNRTELFGKLQVESHLRGTITDSELIVLAYRKWGVDAPKYIIGDYAFVIWDVKNRQLFAARDISGNRTFYYHYRHRQFAFSTAVFPLLTLPSVKKELNELWLAEFLGISGTYESVDIHSTPYQQVEQLPPAHTLIISNGKLALTRYANISDVEPLHLKSNADYEEAFQEVFQEAVNVRLRTHKQVGAALSGGLDSGAVASFAVKTLQQQGKQLHAYSYVPVGDFEDWTSKTLIANERPYIQSTVRHVGNIRENYLDFAGTSPYSEVDELLQTLEVPYKYFENSFWIKGLYEQAERDQAGVLLTGARGNFTISWGPAMDYYAKLLKYLKLGKFYKEIQMYSGLTGVDKSRLIRVAGKKAFPFMVRGSYGDVQVKLPEHVNPDFAKRTDLLNRMPAEDNEMLGKLADAVEVRKERFSNLSIANKNGALATKMSLRYGLWERDATNDPRVVRFCLSVPIEQYVQNGQDRSLVRRATLNYLPDDVRLNQRKRGVQPADWVHRMLPKWSFFISELQALCKDDYVAEYLNAREIQQAIAEIGVPKADQAFNPRVKMLMHSYIVSRFLHDFHQQEANIHNYQLT
ncbi:asparagine synthase-related protein [Paenibacillus sedimenti]|uniref:asparagine synthase (glutamine-hydrolyzing) n=1 Tax=Paenibacillus sedimenti TaxID=2770274 RepID=A0A926KPG7_9BACL|nr:asparagine synthase-related protein [Paenibacillus sedimenti]MBD0379745.1 asparagine synthetase B [Paenibacillus sedimenti]